VVWGTGGTIPKELFIRRGENTGRGGDGERGGCLGGGGGGGGGGLGTILECNCKKRRAQSDRTKISHEGSKNKKKNPNHTKNLLNKGGGNVVFFFLVLTCGIFVGGRAKKLIKQTRRKSTGWGGVGGVGKASSKEGPKDL